MKRLVPKTLRARLVLVILAALALAQGLGAWLFFDQRGLAVQAALAQEAAGRAANVAVLLEQAPPDLHASILRAASSPLVQFALGPAPMVDHADHAGGGAVAANIRAMMQAGPTRDIRVELHARRKNRSPIAMPGMSEEMTRRMARMSHAALTSVEMRISIALGNAQWLNVATRFNRPPYQWAWGEAATFVVSALLIALALWLVLGRLTGPLRHLADAADQLGRGEDVAEIAVSGPEELRRLTDAFNRMQTRLKRFVDDRTLLLAALGHDLRSPLTALRVRAELVDDDETRDRLVATIEEMQEMVAATLAFARGMATSEPVEAVDLADFVATLTGEIAETGGDLAWQAPGAPVPMRLRPNATRRALRNVIENAIRYGERARVRIDTTSDTARIFVDDDGPGIPTTEHDRVFDPFVRLEVSRSRETGGTGLGLSIARTIIRAHGGDITMKNRDAGGLTVTVTLPRLEDNQHDK